MVAKQVKTVFLVTAWILVAIFLIISLLGVLYQPLNAWSAKVTNRNYNGEGLIEHIEAICWFVATLIYAKVTTILFKIRKEKLTKFVYVVIVMFCIVAFGEEISWGQHLFNYEVSDTVKLLNKQRETNIHNLNLSLMLQIARDNPLYPWFHNFTRILNPLFYLICIMLWVVIPLCKRSLGWGKNKLIGALPETAVGTVIFCGVNAMIYLVVDKLFFDVGEIFELALSLVALMSASDAYLQAESAEMCLSATPQVAESLPLQ